MWLPRLPQLHLSLDRVASLAIIVMCLLVGYDIVVSKPGVAVARSPTRPQPSTYSQGERLDDIPGLNFTAAQKTLILFIRSTCRYCTESMPFYRALIASATKNRSLQIAVVSTETVEATRAYLTEHGLSIDPTRVVHATGLKVSGTPTLILVDGNGQVLRLWRGQIPKQGESKVLQLVVDGAN